MFPWLRGLGSWWGLWELQGGFKVLGLWGYCQGFGDEVFSLGGRGEGEVLVRGLKGWGFRV